MATIEQLVERTKYLVDDGIDVDAIIELFNQCLEDISDIANYTKVYEVEMEANNGILTNVPDDLIEIISLTLQIGDSDTKIECVPYNSSRDTSYLDTFYTLVGNNIVEIKPTPKQKYKVTILYYAELPYIPNRDIDPSLSIKLGFPARYHNLLSLFAAARYFENWEEDISMQQNFRAQYAELRNALEYHSSVRDNKVNNNRVNIEQGWY